MKIALPVICQNGHKATSYYNFDIRSMDFVWELPSKKETCDCPKGDIGEGWFQNGKPELVNER